MKQQNMQQQENIILNENDKAIKDGKEIANKFNKYFANIIKKLNLKENTRTSFDSQDSCRMIKMKFGKKTSLLKSLLKMRLQTQLRIYLHARQVFQIIYQFLL